jgi:hypothetical protein
VLFFQFLSSWVQIFIELGRVAIIYEFQNLTPAASTARDCVVAANWVTSTLNRICGCCTCISCFLISRALDRSDLTLPTVRGLLECSEAELACSTVTAKRGWDDRQEQLQERGVTYNCLISSCRFRVYLVSIQDLWVRSAWEKADYIGRMNT